MMILIRHKNHKCNRRREKNLILFFSCVALQQFECRLILSHLNSLAQLLSSETGGIMFILLYGNACGTCFHVTIRSVFFPLFPSSIFGVGFSITRMLFSLRRNMYIRLRVPPRIRCVYLFRVALVTNAMLHTMHRASPIVQHCTYIQSLSIFKRQLNK